DKYRVLRIINIYETDLRSLTERKKPFGEKKFGGKREGGFKKEGFKKDGFKAKPKGKFRD
ncbi:MAG: hypothetical protein ACFNNL_10365, partial [Kingella oralis]